MSCKSRLDFLHNFRVARLDRHSTCAPTYSPNCNSKTFTSYIYICFAMTDQQRSWEVSETKDGNFKRYCGKGPCGYRETTGCRGIASGCRTDRPFIPLSKLSQLTTAGNINNEIFDIPVKCDTCDYVGNFQVYKS